MGRETDKPAGQPLAHSASQNWTLGMFIKDVDKPASLVLHLQVHAAANGWCNDGGLHVPARQGQGSRYLSCLRHIRLSMHPSRP